MMVVVVGEYQTCIGQNLTGMLKFMNEGIYRGFAVEVDSGRIGIAV
ncbi:MAG: hypothetical protein LR015_14925 [Verrucomicrobia bacterium]|nr:hypothetical protein [Verrucomicrobiota bacterium]